MYSLTPQQQGWEKDSMNRGCSREQAEGAMSPCIPGKTSMWVLSELDGLSQELADSSAQVLGALQPRCV